MRTSESRATSGLEAFNEMGYDLDQAMTGANVIHHWLLKETLAQGITASVQAGHRGDRRKLSELVLFMET